MATLAEIRAKLLAQQTKTENNNNSGGDRASYAFWNIPEDTPTSLRFLPDADPNNTFFWVDRTVIKIPFNGIRGEHSNPITVQIPCMDMFGKQDYILNEIRPWWNDPTLKPLASKYWKKTSHLFQGFVVNDTTKEENIPENPIRRFIINPEIFQLIKAILMDPEVEDLPTDYNGGYDFRLVKTKGPGGYNNYKTSSWARKARALDDNERAAIEQNGLFNLRDFLPKEPTDEEQEAIKEMFQLSVDGQAYDPAQFGKFFRPSGYSSNENTTSAAPAKAEPVKETPIAATKEETKAGPAKEEKQNAADILAALRKRKEESAE